MKHQEVVKSDGKRIVFCNFEELLTEALGVPSLEAAERYREPSGEFVIHCPFCRAEGHRKHKLYLKSDLTVGHCFVCTRSYVNVTDEVKVEYRPPSFLTPRLREWFKPTIKDPKWALDRYWKEFDEYSEKGVRYLMGRHQFMDPLWKILGFKFWEGNVVMPFWWKSELIYYQIRFSDPKARIRYFFPPVDQKPVWTTPEPIGTGKDLIVVEGIYDAIAAMIQAPGRTPVAVLGSSVSDYQLLQIREFVPDSILVWMDDTEKSKGIADRLRVSLGYCPIRIIPSDGTDPEENMCSRIARGRDLQWIRGGFREPRFPVET